MMALCSGVRAEASISKYMDTLLSVLLTCCPPGPLLLLVSNRQAFKRSVISIMRQRYKRPAHASDVTTRSPKLTSINSGVNPNFFISWHQNFFKGSFDGVVHQTKHTTTKTASHDAGSGYAGFNCFFNDKISFFA